MNPYSPYTLEMAKQHQASYRMEAAQDRIARECVQESKQEKNANESPLRKRRWFFGVGNKLARQPK
ncbi:hypothetical protein OZ401_005034 (plasmid) [Candidatus Chlorohelix allophototropha]|uniref:Uncharacterized protein n=1 Tax=Candidatus Chlorohelix allophototropha TaxID=3003348 RepID=A0ABY9BAU0_9CHLR|nr:hypothetical protein OZ401_004771 [Chloroflexota bacterium L227-S17]WJW70303.1 hypothetical protein OZ401_005034 [Chloroflexota bacterium L227-S17]